jgi:hypothetical protein
MSIDQPKGGWIDHVLGYIDARQVDIIKATLT